MLYFLLQIAIVLPGLNVVGNAPRHNRLFFIQNCPTSCSLIQRHLWFVQGAAFAMRERNETPFFYAQMKTRNYCTVRRRNGPTGHDQLGATRQVKDN